MKHKSILTEEVQNLIAYFESSEHRSIIVENFHLAALSTIYPHINKTLIITSADERVELLFETLQPNWDFNKGIYFPPVFKQELTPAGFLSNVDQHRKQANSIICSLEDEVKFIITSKNTVKEKTFNRKKKDAFTLNSNTTYEGLLNWLSNAKYERTEMVLSPGFYAVRGGLIDVFSLSSGKPVRANFIEDKAELFVFDIDSQLTSADIESYSITPIYNPDGKLSLTDVFEEAIIIEIIDDHIIKIGESETQERYHFNLDSLELTEFISSLQSQPNLQYETSESLQSIGFINPEGKIIVPSWFSDKKSRSSEVQAKPITPVLELTDIEEGDFLVHRTHGIGKYYGLKVTENKGIIQEFLILEYQDGGRIFVSTEKLKSISFYASQNEIGVVTDNLSKPNIWKRKKEKAKKQAEEIVDSLVQLYAERSKISRPPYDVDTNFENLFLSKFPFIDTPDQQKVWSEISEDLHFPFPMNRLLCGDVGFGKTEIAIRSTFRAVYGGKQVAILAPTTILVNQLFNAFKSRLESFSIYVDVISRFRTAKEVKNIKSNLAAGKIDVIIGTHALLSDKISYKNLGMLIIDEEHRFGVKQKEKIQHIQKTVDVLSMSATPIPRTLHMSFSGVRNISTLYTAPKARLPISTQISYFDKKLIKKAILFEINRGGQVFFVHNNVKSIPEIMDKLQAILPDVRFSSAHGQESPRSLEKTMLRFLTRKIDVLVCTSIIETGLDIHNANTIIINKAHFFGLSQLYQIRGRVGRSSRPAYAYLLIPKGTTLKKDAYKRLKAIEENISLGSGYNISKMDLEIRGAGTLFGYKQSGGLGYVGFELYSHFINDAFRRKTEEAIKKPLIDIDSIAINIFSDCTIPIDYIKSNNTRLRFYRKLANAETISEINSVECEIKNRFGLLPESIDNLINSTKYSLKCAYLGIQKISYSNENIIFYFDKKGITENLTSLFETVSTYLDKINKLYWFKEGKNDNLYLTVTGIWYSDIPNFMTCFLGEFNNVLKTITEKDSL